MVCYTDFLTLPSSHDNLEIILQFARKLGYCRIGVPAGTLESRETRSILEIAIIRGAMRAEVARQLTKIPRRYIPIVDAAGPDAARYASVNKRILGFIVRPGMERLVDRSTRRLFEERGWGLVVVPLSHIRQKPYTSRSWKYLAIVMRRAYAYGIDLAFASEARDVYDLWHPMHVVGIAETIGVPGVIAKSWLSSAVSRNLGKLLAGGKP